MYTRAPENSERPPGRDVFFSLSLDAIEDARKRISLPIEALVPRFTTTGNNLADTVRKAVSPFTDITNLPHTPNPLDDVQRRSATTAAYLTGQFLKSRSDVRNPQFPIPEFDNTYHVSPHTSELNRSVTSPEVGKNNAPLDVSSATPGDAKAQQTPGISWTARAAQHGGVTTNDYGTVATGPMDGTASRDNPNSVSTSIRDELGTQHYGVPLHARDVTYTLGPTSSKSSTHTHGSIDPTLVEMYETTVPIAPTRTQASASAGNSKALETIGKEPQTDLSRISNKTSALDKSQSSQIPSHRFRMKSSNFPKRTHQYRLSTSQAARRIHRLQANPPKFRIIPGVSRGQQIAAHQQKLLLMGFKQPTARGSNLALRHGYVGR
jgi:hypothetical protein